MSFSRCCNSDSLPLCLCQEPPTEGTVKPYPSFNAETDAKTLRTAMKGLGKLVTIDMSFNVRVHVRVYRRISNYSYKIKF